MIRWRVHLAAESPHKAGLVLGIMAVFSVIFWAAAGPLWALAPFAVGFLATWSFWLPTTYTLTEEGIEVVRTPFRRFYQWERFRRVDPHPDGLFLSPFSKPSARDPFRGLFLHKAPPEALEFVRARLRASRESP